MSSPIVMTLDAGGTNFVFSAIQDNKEIVAPVALPSNADDLEKCLGNLVKGFSEIKAQLPVAPSAISFAFPGPTDYANGVIGDDLPNFPSFRGGVALGPYLQEKFGIPVYLNNDGNLFAYGEALAGMLIEVNKKLADSGSPRSYRNLLGLTFGTGFGAGIVTNGELLVGDNTVGGEIWCFRNKKFPQCIAEEGVSIRAVQRVYAEISRSDEQLTPKDIFDIAEGTRTGDQNAAKKAFAELGEVAADAIAQAVSLVDGLVVIGGGLAAAAKYFMPSLIAEMNGTIGSLKGDKFPRLPMKAYNLDDPAQFQQFIAPSTKRVKIPGSDKEVDYIVERRVGVAISKLGASTAINLGAYAYAINELNKK